MIDHIIVIYKNYSLLDLQIKNFKKRFTQDDCQFIIVDNTPDAEKKQVEIDVSIVKKYISLSNMYSFDGESHGSAIDTGLQYVTSNIVCISDSDFFWLDKNIYKEAKHKILVENYSAFGTEYNDGTGDSFKWRNIDPQKFDNIPNGFGSFYTRELATVSTWKITKNEMEIGKRTGFVETGFKIRQHILNNKLKTMTFKTPVQGISYTHPNWKPCFFSNDKGVVKGVHYVGASHANLNSVSFQTLERIINTYE